MPDFFNDFSKKMVLYFNFERFSFKYVFELIRQSCKKRNHYILDYGSKLNFYLIVYDLNDIIYLQSNDSVLSQIRKLLFPGYR